MATFGDGCVVVVREAVVMEWQRAGGVAFGRGCRVAVVPDDVDAEQWTRMVVSWRPPPEFVEVPTETEGRPTDGRSPGSER